MNIELTISQYETLHKILAPRTFKHIIDAIHTELKHQYKSLEITTSTTARFHWVLNFNDESEYTHFMLTYV